MNQITIFYTSKLEVIFRINLKKKTATNCNVNFFFFLLIAERWGYFELKIRKKRCTGNAGDVLMLGLDL